MILHFFYLKTLMLFLFLISLGLQAAPTFWQSRHSPIEGVSESIGGVSNGCIIGAKALNLNSPYYQVLRTQNNRFYGHPKLINFIERFTIKAHQDNDLGYVLVGDMSMPGGGRFVSGHASHQNGLDVDIWLQLPKQPWSSQALAKPEPLYLVNNGDAQIIKERWKNEYYQLIKLAAKDSEVARIFVNPAIKKQMCEQSTALGEKDLTWLNKIRPWHYHEYHMHVRLNCMPDDVDCLNQSPIPSSDSCGAELYEWLKPKKQSKAQSSDSKDKKKVTLPERCQIIESQA